MSKVDDLNFRLDSNPSYNFFTLKREDLRALIEFIEVTEEFRKAYFCDESFGRNTKEQNEAWYQARVALGLG